ncbi:MacB family efflux pump subunit [Achromobacter insolitus]|uniref:Pyoverdine export ATP-binding/permease protein PvdT n=4 Tax=Achromobacter insolitus TaxID=217204 RepID=A0A6S7FGX0_9BURK|nr:MULTISPECIES: MacB family efflux pump subunit [Achromobacter]GLK96473.1 macrolide export ATP-binding/permease protein MacB [Achromobacter xylosoxidans]MEB3095669.1 MacB family efflux pump subunit [Achromobacter sp. D10]NGT14293.1 MacB family efflux pump subunit [Achromobacter insolitus]OAD14518.1 macrolide ABC transporter permease/ATP-binding protein MacB [Achromobacter insolitus]OAE64587.1 macrolide ABC transporter permease/ATP-binding protein MacB [Achromobacter insolitus]
MSGPLISLTGVRREFPAGEQTIAVLKDINLAIEAGEMVAIVGASGSGKSTLMNILGCLDRPTRGEYRVDGRSTGELDPDELAELRREHFGFIFQRYHLLSDLTAQGNVEVPAVYAGKRREARLARADELLERLGLGERSEHRPGQLSGGQQQRVSIARALMNGGDIILADEPTGALDTHTGQEVLRILEELNAAGHTIIIVTHDMNVARHAQRIIEISDGEIVSDKRNPDAPRRERLKEEAPALAARPVWQAYLDRCREALRMALLAMNAHRLRTSLTMLGIIIGIAAVVSVVALGEGSRRKILDDISEIGTNTVEIFPGKDFGDEKAVNIRTLVPADAEALARESYVDSVTPEVSTSNTLRFRNVSVNGVIQGVGEQYFRVRAIKLAQGKFFDDTSVLRRAQEVVIDDATRRKLFGSHTEPIGQVVFLGSMPARVIGVTQKKDTVFGSNDTLNVWIPYTTALSRVLGQQHLKSITVRVNDASPPAAAEQAIVRVLTRRHVTKDFFVFNTDAIRKTIERTTATMTLLVSMIALISLMVGGIGVMNIMLVSVTERTREIGVRMAVGARRSDIMQQFLIEAVLVCLIGGAIGIVLSLGLGVLVSKATHGSFQMIYSTASMVAAFSCSTLIGVLFGYLPARNAARLDPVEALARE